MRQHFWAEAVERVTALSDHDVKEGRAPAEFLEYFRLASDSFYLLDQGRDPSKRHKQRFQKLHSVLGPYVVPSIHGAS